MPRLQTLLRLHIAVALSRRLGARAVEWLTCLGPVFARQPVQKAGPGGPEDACRCIICGSAEDEQVLLLCDGCDDAYHTYCLALEEVPAQDFFCPTCMALSRERRAAAGRRAGGVFGGASRGVGQAGRERLRSVSLGSRWLQRPRDYGLWGARNNEVGGERSHTPTLACRGEPSCNPAKSRPGILSLSPEEKAWKMYEVQQSGKAEKYDDSSNDFLTSQKKFKRPLIARSKVKDAGYGPAECMAGVSSDSYSISYVKGKAKENSGSQLGFLQNLLNDISNTSDYSYQLKHGKESFQNFCKTPYGSETPKNENSPVFISNVSFAGDDSQKDSFQPISDPFSGMQSKKVYQSSAMSSSMALSESFLTRLSSFSSKSISKSPIISPGRKIAFTIKKKIEKIVSKELRLYYPEKISKDTCKSINKRVCRMIYEDVALLGEHMFDDFDNLWYDKIKTEILRLVKDIGHT